MEMRICIQLCSCKERGNSIYFKFSILLRSEYLFLVFHPIPPFLNPVPLVADAKSLLLLHFSFQYSKANSHDKEVQRLYEEMEQQIRTEKERIRNEVSIPRYCIMWCSTRVKHFSFSNTEIKLYFKISTWLPCIPYCMSIFVILWGNLMTGALSIQPKIWSFQNGDKWYKNFLRKFLENLEIVIVFLKSKPDSAKNIGFSRRKIKWNSSMPKKKSQKIGYTCETVSVSRNFVKWCSVLICDLKAFWKHPVVNTR